MLTNTFILSCAPSQFPSGAFTVETFVKVAYGSGNRFMFSYNQAGNDNCEWLSMDAPPHTVLSLHLPCTFAAHYPSPLPTTPLTLFSRPLPPPLQQSLHYLPHPPQALKSSQLIVNSCRPLVLLVLSHGMLSVLTSLTHSHTRIPSLAQQVSLSGRGWERTEYGFTGR